MSMRKQRPTALDVTDGDVLPRKRAIIDEPTEPVKRAKLSNAAIPRSNDLPERSPPSEQTFYEAPGTSLANNRERRPSEEDQGRDEAALLVLYDFGDENGDNSPPVFAFTSFAFFNALKRDMHVTLEPLLMRSDNENEPYPGLAATGFAIPQAFIEDDEDDADDNDNERDDAYFVRLDEIIATGYDAMDFTSRFWVQTRRAYYTLYQPSHSYQSFWDHFYTGYRISQHLIAQALKPHPPTREQFLDIIRSEGYNEQDFSFARIDLLRILKRLGSNDFGPLKHSPLLRDPAVMGLDRLSHISPVDRATPQKGPPKLITDHNVLNIENMAETRISPAMHLLGGKYFPTSSYKIVGIAPSKLDSSLTPHDTAARDHLKLTERRYLWAYIDRAWNWGHKRVEYLESVSPLSPYLCKAARLQYTKAVAEGNASFVVQVNDYVLVLRDNGRVHELQDRQVRSFEAMEAVTPPLQLSQLFWFAKVRKINTRNGIVHIQWLEHSTESLLYGFDDPYEVFFTSLCDDIPIKKIVATTKVLVGASAPPGEFYVKFLHDKSGGSFTNPLALGADERDRKTCPACDKGQMRWEEPTAIPNDGVGFRNHEYHLGDFVLYRPKQVEPGKPADVRQIVGVRFSNQGQDRIDLQLQACGRVSDLEDLDEYPQNRLLDERELFITSDIEVCSPLGLIRPILVVHVSLVATPRLREQWVRENPYHFYVGLQFPTKSPASWREHQTLLPQNLKLCSICIQDKRSKEQERFQAFEASFAEKPLKILDLFAGTGLYSASLSEGCHVGRLGYGVEMVPSIAKTLKDNCPQATIYNQDANDFYRKLAKQSMSGDGDLTIVPLSKVEREPPVLPPKSDVDILVAGFPCPPHSALNMYRKVDDPRNSLILLTLSVIELFSPKYIYLENVPGFLSRFQLGGYQESRYNIQGGMKQGGIKLVLRALLNMGYQVRFGLLQAGDYGTPQTRIRFFLIAAHYGLTLPELPLPTHAFPDTKGFVSADLSFKMNVADTEVKVQPISRKHGRAAHPPVKVKDAIGDLPKFDMKHPQSFKTGFQKQTAERARRQALGIPAFESLNGVYCGPPGALPDYQIPRTRFQIQCRLDNLAQRREIRHLQHFTKAVKAEHIARLYRVPMQAGADYRDIPHYERQASLATSLSFAGRNRFARLGAFYGRLDSNGFFPTVITNFDVAAKQGQVLHPNQHRLATVREMARAQGFPDDFHFISQSVEMIGKEYDDGSSIEDEKDDDDSEENSPYKSMNILFRQIGNAMPWPVGEALGRELRKAVYEDWTAQRLGR